MIYKKYWISIFVFAFIFIINLINYSVNAEIIEDNTGIWAESISFTLKEGELVDLIGEGKAELNYEDYKIEGDYIRYNAETYDIHSIGNVSVNTEEYQLYTEEITGKLEDEVFDAIGEVLFKGSNLEVISGKLHIKGQNGLMTFEDNVILELNEIKALADTLIYNTAKETILLEGNVSGENEKIEFTGNKMEIDIETEQVKLLDGAGVLLKAEGDG